MFILIYFEWRDTENQRYWAASSTGFPRLSGEPEAQSDKVTGLVFVGYKKAFDLIDHNLLLSKLELIGIGKDFSRHYLLITWEVVSKM